MFFVLHIITFYCFCTDTRKIKPGDVYVGLKGEKFNGNEYYKEALEKGAKVQAYDPKAIDTAKYIFKDKIIYAKSAYEALENADCLLLLTEWNEFRRPDFDKIKSLLKEPVIFDGRNQYEAKRLQQRGFEYHSVGRNTVKI